MYRKREREAEGGTMKSSGEGRRLKEAEGEIQ